MSTTNPFCNGEQAAYEWPCKRCGRPFLPRRMTTFRDAPYQQCCEGCQITNLLEMVFSDDPDDPDDERKP